MQEMYHSSIRSAGDLGGVFESDSETNYFYLCKIAPNGHPTILNSIQVNLNNRVIEGREIDIVWSLDETVLGLKVQERILCAFDCHNLTNLFQNMNSQQVNKLIDKINWR
jgi:hypothetical protein